MINTIDFLREHEHAGTDAFRNEAQFVKDNWDWLKYSYAVAVKVRRRMSDMGLTQKQLADAMGCTQQHISVLLAGRSNLTLETLAKLEKALRLDLVGTALTTFVDTNASVQRSYLCEPGAGEPRFEGSTSAFVDGYQPRKKKGPKKK